MMSKNSIVPFLKDYLIKFLTRPFLLDTNEKVTKTRKKLKEKSISPELLYLTKCKRIYLFIFTESTFTKCQIRGFYTSIFGV